MRHDKLFNEGESIPSVHFAKLVSRYVDWLVTVNPHLHRRNSLDDVYSVPGTVIHAALLLLQWIRASVESRVLIRPDRESAQ